MMLQMVSVQQRGKTREQRKQTWVSGSENETGERRGVISGRGGIRESENRKGQD